MPRHRTFLAIDVGTAVRGNAVALREKLAATGASAKWEDAANFHITLQFLGDVDDRELVGVCRAAAAVAGKIAPFKLTIGGVGAFPTPRRPKILWAGVTAGRDELVELFTQLEAALDTIGVYRKEDRPYAPHLTLGRASDEAAGQVLAAELPKYEEWSAGSVFVEEVQILRSEQSRNGPVYSVIGRANLRGREKRLADEDDE